MAKGILVLDSEDVALAPATLCAEGPEEARHLNLPMFNRWLAELSAGLEIRANDECSYDLFEDGERVGRLEVFEVSASMVR
jgi:hypothetical protein